jgi:hypothetical protein
MKDIEDVESLTEQDVRELTEPTEPQDSKSPKDPISIRRGSKFLCMDCGTVERIVTHTQERVFLVCDHDRPAGLLPKLSLASISLEDLDTPAGMLLFPAQAKEIVPAY